MTGLLIKLVLAYLLGSISGSLVVGRFKHVDIRTLGSGNAGGTNAFRTQGLTFALGAVVIDIGKSILAAAWLPGLQMGALTDQFSLLQTALMCGFAAVLGHCYPVYYGFRGGKGAATAIGVLMVTAPWLLVPMLATWLLVLVATGYVGLATVLAGFSLVPASYALDAPRALLVFSVAIALFMTFTHRANLRRLRAGTENRFNKVRLAHWFGKHDDS